MSIITLCGSTRFKEEFEQENARLTLEGHIVLSVGFFEKYEGITLSEETVKMFGELHLKKIDLSDSIHVINVGGYIGESTRREIEYAKKTGKKVTYLEDIK